MRQWIRRQALYAGHMLLSVGTMSFVSIHAASHLFKREGSYRLYQLFVPFTSPTKVSIGVVAFELMIATAVSVWYQRRLSYRRWQRVHQIGYLAYGLAVVHVAATAHHVLDGPILVGLGSSLAVLGALAALRFVPSVRLGAGDPA